MELQIISFGKVAEFLESQQLTVNEIKDTNQLKSYLEHTFPQLATMKYKLAVNKLLVQENVPLNNKDSVAIMPPFSGG
ncbi:MAG: molybdopterin synthase sulfur carrier subunit [Chitinophagaceae bacterium]|nr:MAG: molybdopterin synthase sulfur carrier subunit [Chitinophagaceae bacterium]